MQLDNIETIRLFGSYARGDYALNSDYDILVVLKNNEYATDNVRKEIESLFNHQISISWYSVNKIVEFFEQGHLFAWHLYLESKEISSSTDFIDNIGTPNEYSSAATDIASLIDILRPIEAEVIGTPQNLIYEAGLLHVCARNIAMSAMPILKKQFDFSADAALNLDLGISKADYGLLIQSRYCSTRGVDPPFLIIDKLLMMQRQILDWALKILLEIEKISIK
ncbi:MAG: nucleotidyltransferase domain-containing protein [Chitinophaga sp.]|uniref:nucleotidyltransferase domain-containing protein n=1 Tax=Chitinophaga sp. TaxID=1869181 RepID=UPI0025B890AA|nr:nucleotidyltransferase domain-containing protein [Chitinophaga sp.]MBV8252327.1 nucleotidyltransferase domain-containing protein [Chitinophaga sp.]